MHIYIYTHIDNDIIIRYGIPVHHSYRSGKNPGRGSDEMGTKKVIALIRHVLRDTEVYYLCCVFFACTYIYIYVYIYIYIFFYIITIIITIIIMIIIIVIIIVIIIMSIMIIIPIIIVIIVVVVSIIYVYTLHVKLSTSRSIKQSSRSREQQPGSLR